MGRDWYWGGKSSGGGGTTATHSSNTSSSAVKKDKDREKLDVNTRQNPGCMSGVLHLFDFHQFQFPMTQPPCFKPSGLQDYPTSAKGVNAPRNSLESNEGVDKEASEMKQKDFDFDISVEIRKETAHVKTRTDDQLSCSDSSSSPGPKTPSLVARLMGLDILPDSVSSSSSPASSVRLNKVQVHTKTQKMNSATNEVRFENSGSRSLPDTPRISSARRSDVDARHSLQIFRENVPSSGEVDYLGRIKDQNSRKRELKNDEENRSPGLYARQIVKQVKESVSRRVGLDITNTITTTTTNNNNNNVRVKPKEVDVVILKSKKPKRESNLNKHNTSSSPSSYSPRLRLLEERKNIKVQESSSPPPLSSSSPPPPTRSILSENIKTSTEVPKSRKPKLPHVPQQQKCKKASCERFTQRREPKSKSKTTTTTCSSAPSTSTSSSCNDVQASKPGSRLSSSPCPLTCAAPALQQDTFADEIRYVSEILKCTGIHRDTLVSFTSWYSPSHPLDPSVFAYLEKFDSAVKIRSNRKLMFDLTDELLVSFIKPYLNMKPWRVDENRFLHNRREMFGEQLMQHLCYEISKCPSSNCQTLEDIDDLIDRDIPRMRMIPIYEESENVAFEIERHILDTLVHETAAEVVQLRVK